MFFRKRYFLFTGLIIFVILTICGILIIKTDTHNNIVEMSPREIIDLYLKIRTEGRHDELPQILCHPNDEAKINNLMASDAEKTLYSFLAKRKTAYEKIIDANTAEVGIVLSIAGKIIPLQQMILKKAGGIWKLRESKFNNTSKEQLHEMLKITPVDPDIYYYLGKLYSTDRYVLAAQYYEKYLELSDNMFWDGPDMQGVIKQGKEIDSFIEQYKPFVDANPFLPRNDTLCAKLALAYMDKGDLVNAKKYLDMMGKILEKSPNKYMRKKYNNLKELFLRAESSKIVPEY